MEPAGSVIDDLIEVVEHLAYSHNFRSEDVQRRVAQLLSGIRARIAAEPDQASPADPTPAATPPGSGAPSPAPAPPSASGAASAAAPAADSQPQTGAAL
jgi:hypothetical protein